MDMWLEYQKELRGTQYIKTEQGFIQFTINEKECFIQELFIRPDCRLKGHATALVTAAKEEGKKQGCTFLTSNVQIATDTATDSMKFHLKYGARIVSAHNNVIVMAKEI